MKKLLLVILLILIFTLPATSIDKEITRVELVKKIAELSEWCGQNNELPTKMVLLILKGALLSRQDTLLMNYNKIFAEEQIKVLQQVIDNSKI